MIEHIHSEPDGPHVYATLFIPSELVRLPWGEEEFNCLVCQYNSVQIREIGHELAEWLVGANTDWIWIAGSESKWLHDLIDQTSVRLGRQRAVGAGSPMTSWVEDAERFPDLCKLLESGVPGGNGDYNLALIVGSKAELEAFVDQMRTHMSSRGRTSPSTRRAGKPARS